MWLGAIFIDASAIVAILTGEDEATQFVDAIEAVSERLTAPLATFEATSGICRDVLQFLAIAGVQSVAITAIDAKTTLDAFSRSGKGYGHPARLNMGDCFAYAMAAGRDAALLYNGNDFNRIDARSAID